MPHIIEIIQYLSFYVWLISLSIMSSRATLVVTNARFPFFLKKKKKKKAELYSSVCVLVCLARENKISKSDII